MQDKNKENLIDLFKDEDDCEKLICNSLEERVIKLGLSEKRQEELKKYVLKNLYVKKILI